MINPNYLIFPVKDNQTGTEQIGMIKDHMMLSN